MRKVVFLLILALVPVMAATANAAMVHMKNGDRLSGKVVKMKKGVLQLATPYAGTIKIQWDQIDTLESETPLDIYLKDMSKITGPAVADTPGHVTVKPKNDEWHNLDAAKVAAINTPYHEWDVKGGVSLGFNKQSGNTNKANVGFQGGVSAQKKKNRYNLAGDFNWGEDSGTRNAYSWSVEPGYDRYLTERLFINANAQFEHDEFQDLDLRSSFGTGLGYDFLKGDRLNLTVQAGPAYVSEDYDQRDDRDYAAAQWKVDFSWWIYKKYVQIFHTQNGFLSLEHSDEYIWQTKSGLKFPFTEKLYTSLQYNYDWNNRPASGKVKWDEKIMMAIGYNF